MKIAVAVDGSEHAFRAAEQAVKLAKHMPSAVLEVIYVSDFDKAMDERLLAESPESLYAKREHKVHQVMELAKTNGVAVETTKLKGNPSQEIIRHVNDSGIDQLFMGSRGLNALQEMILGSVSHKVMKHVHCPVTIVK